MWFIPKPGKLRQYKELASIYGAELSSCPHDAIRAICDETNERFMLKYREEHRPYQLGQTSSVGENELIPTNRPRRLISYDWLLDK